MAAKSKSTIPNRALSVRQPLAEKIITGEKNIEYRTIPVKLRGTIYIYASKTPNLEVYKQIKKEPGTFDVGVLVGTVEIVGCSEEPDNNDNYHWFLANPNRLRKPIIPDNHPQPVWFKPFKE